MKITTRIVLQHFLAELLKQLRTAKVDGLDNLFDDFFTKDEIMNIIKTSSGANVNEPIGLNASKQELLGFLSNANILDYFLKDWNAEITSNKVITSIEVYRTLDQLGLHTHYLMSKVIAEWDEYDFSNYRMLCGKAGKIYTIYGVYDSGVKAEDVESVTTHPKRFYETREKATTGMQELITEKGFQKEEVHILPRLVGDA